LYFDPLMIICFKQGASFLKSAVNPQ